MKAFSLVVVGFVFFLGQAARGERDPLKFEGPLVATSASDSLTGKKMALTLPGMGTAFSWNFGSLHALYEALEAVRNNEVMLAGNSGGAVPALYFSCRGFSPHSIRDAERLVLNFNPAIANEDQYGKLTKVLLHVATEFDDKPLLDYIAEVIPPECKPNLPFIIPVGNAEIIERRLDAWPHSALNVLALARLPFLPRPPRDILGTRDLRHRQLDQFSFWVTETSEHDSTPHKIGKACTYLVSPSLYARLAQIDENDRLCDLRVIEDAEDMRFAMRLAVGEATYYEPLGEDPSYFHRKRVSQARLLQEGKLLVSRPEIERAPFRRIYNGGLIMPGSVGRDLIRLDPTLTLISSGRPYFHDPDTADKWQIADGLKQIADKVSPDYSHFLKLKRDKMGQVVNDKTGAPLWTLPPDGQGLFLREWYGYDVNKLVYLDQHLVDVAVRVDPGMTSMSKRSGEARKDDLKDELLMGYRATWACLKAADCGPLSALTIPALSTPAPGGRYAAILNPAQPLRELPLRPPAWKPRTRLPVARQTVAFPWD